MLKVEYLVFCEEIEETQVGKSLLRTFDALYSSKSGLPARKNPFLGSLRIRSLGRGLVDADFRLKLVVEFEENIIKTLNMDFEHMTIDENHSIDVDIDFQDIAFEKFGLYYFKIEVDGEHQLASTLLVEDIRDRIER